MIVIRLNLSIACFRRQKGRWLFSTRLMAQRPTSLIGIAKLVHIGEVALQDLALMIDSPHR